MTKTTIETTTGTYQAERRTYLDVNGNPIYYITPLTYESNHLPYVPGYRRNNKRNCYTTQSYNIEMDLQHFITKFEEITGLNKEKESMEIQIPSSIEIISQALAELQQSTDFEESDRLLDIILNALSHQDVTETHVMQVWYVYDCLYFDKETAELFEEPTEQAKETYIIARKGETIQEGTDVHTRFSSFDDALEELNQ